MQMWGGHECTVNRVGGRFLDQTRLSGHEDRIADLDLFASLGVTALRYPVLWERVAPERPSVRHWSWSDARLGRLRDLGLRPIVGLVHHGAGPAYTNLLDPDFATGLADHAQAVAERYPWVTDWTPINEPLTTARFGALYGVWHPHLRDEAAFWLAVLNQIDAIRLAMDRVRRVNPAARLIQTEDLGRTYSTPAASVQASYDNERRWMTWDLLSGRVTKDHPLWPRLNRLGLAGRLRALEDDPCPPDVIGINHYLTSDRFLDDAVAAYPPHLHGGNGYLDYADVEAIRVLQPPPAGLAGAIEEAWERYGLPIAVTEAHNGCTREEQIRWLRDVWTEAQALCVRGVEIEAITAWSLLGAYHWNSLLTREDGHYEPGAFDLRGGAPRRTAVAKTIQTLSSGGPWHPSAAGPGWWERDVRLQYRPVTPRPLHAPPSSRRRPPAEDPRPVLIVGETGTLGQALGRACALRGIDYVLTGRRQLDLSDGASIQHCLATHAPWAVINAAGWVRVDEAESAAEACLAANRDGAIGLARACRDRGIQFATFSSDLVFDGSLRRPYVENDLANPLNVYGRSKLEAEAGVLALGGCALVVRTAAFFSPHDVHNFAAHLCRRLMLGQPMEAADDLTVSPTYVPDLVDAVLDLVIDGEAGIWHLANTGEATWASFATRLAQGLGLDAALVRPRPARDFGWVAARPRYSALASERGQMLPSLEDAVRRYAAILERDVLTGFVGAAAPGRQTVEPAFSPRKELLP